MNFQQLQQHAFECLEQDNYTEAISLYKQCIDANLTEIYNYWYLGIALLLQGNEPEAQLTWLSIIAQGDSEEIDIWTAELIKVLDTEASRYQQSGNLQQAEKIYWQILQQAPEQAEAHYNLGNLLAAQGKFEQAVVLYQQALEINPSYSQAHYTLGSTLYNQGEFVDALLYYYQAIALEPEYLIYRQEFVKCLANVSFSSSVDVKILKEIENCFTVAGIHPQNLIPVTMMALQIDDKFKHLLQVVQSEQQNTIEEEYRQGKLNYVLQNRLFQSVLRYPILADLILENLLTVLRKTILSNFNVNKNAARFDVSLNLEFLCSLALQCFNTEYIYTVTNEEELQVIQLQTDLKTLLKNTLEVSDNFQVKVAIYSMYFPLHTLDGIWKIIEITDEHWNSGIRLLINKHLQDYQIDAEIKNSIISKQENYEAVAVKSQYEENPYPRWLGFNKLPSRSISDYLRSLFPYFNPPLFLEQPTQILDAGCGTGQTATYFATMLNDVEVSGFCHSRKSIIEEKS